MLVVGRRCPHIRIFLSSRNGTPPTLGRGTRTVSHPICETPVGFKTWGALFRNSRCEVKKYVCTFREARGAGSSTLGRGLAPRCLQARVVLHGTRCDVKLLLRCKARVEPAAAELPSGCYLAIHAFSLRLRRACPTRVLYRAVRGCWES